MNRFKTKKLIALVLLALLMSAGVVLAESGAVNRAIMGPVLNDASSCTVVVNSGQSVAAALNNAQNGSVICVRTGVYKEQAVLDRRKSNLTLKAYPGDKPVLDGQGNIPTSKYQGLIQVNASGSVVEGFEVRNSATRGIVVTQYSNTTQPIRDVVVRGNIVRNSWDMGIVVNGSVDQDAENILIENNIVFENLRVNASNHVGGSGLLFVESKNSIARGNVVYNNLGEGLVAGRWTTNILFEDNVTYDNKHANIYLSATTNPLLRRNLVFCTNDRTYWRGTKAKPAPGITLRDESFPNQTVKPPPSSGQVIINNIVVGCGNNFWVSTQIAGGGLNGAVIANNTFANARGDTGSGANNVLIEGDVSLSNTKFVNNIMFQSDSSAASAHLLVKLGTPNMSTFTLANNLYSVAPSKNWPSGESNRKIVDPRLVNPVLPVKGSVPDPQGFRIQSNSPAINAGTNVSQVTEDFFKEGRSGALDIGADEFGGAPPRQDGRIVVSLTTSPAGSSQAFGFTTSYAPGSFQLSNGGTNDSGSLSAGTYSVSITPVSGWVTNVSCDDGSQPGSIDLSADETVTCAFTAEQESEPVTRVVVVKKTVPAGDSQSFQFTSDFAGAFSLSHNGQKAADVDPGVYSVSETIPEGWTQESATCSDGSMPTAIDVAQGETVTCTFTNRKTTTGGGDLNAVVYLTAPVPGSVGGIDYNKGDIVAYDGRTGQWSLFFDGSDVGISRRIDDFVILDDGSALPTMLMVLNGKVKLNGSGGAFQSQMQDIVRFRPTSLGEDTAGGWDLYFDGSDVGLAATSEKIDALAVKPNGTLIISTTGKASVSGGGKTITAQDEDLLAFTPSSTGNNTSGTWALELDATKIAGMKPEDVTALWFDSGSGTYYVALLDSFTVTGISGTPRSILAIPGSGAPSLWWDSASQNYPGGIDGLHIVLNP